MFNRFPINFDYDGIRSSWLTLSVITFLTGMNKTGWNWLSWVLFIGMVSMLFLGCIRNL